MCRAFAAGSCRSTHTSPTRRRAPVSILEMEDQNFSTEKGKENELEPLFCFAISAKRYALFNLDGMERRSSGRLRRMALDIMPRRTETRRKPATTETAASGFGKRTFGSRSSSAALSDKPREVDYAFRREMMKPARSRYGATRPAVLDWFKRYNEGRPYAEQVKPFNFLLDLLRPPPRGHCDRRPDARMDPKLEAMRPVAPYEKDIEKALAPRLRPQFG